MPGCIASNLRRRTSAGGGLIGYAACPVKMGCAPDPDVTLQKIVVYRYPAVFDVARQICVSGKAIPSGDASMRGR